MDDLSSADKNIIEIVGQISQKDIDDGTVLIFRINEDKYPAHIMQKVAEQIKNGVVDTFQGQVKAMILPQTVDVQVLRDILKDVTDE